ncbi:MAG TPA: glucoamylase family protein [Phycisphaerae bacterium]|nr:glucoamylase family protein [Phycisphaerae bacterium]HRY66984.1 glucoamylase family protein [Phycisphaerae bacterium]HSA28823.1 glucoamylase family protein [Phycisphaerae bacterium]
MSPRRTLTLTFLLYGLSSVSLRAGDTIATSQPRHPPEVEALLTQVQQAVIRYFDEFGHPLSGLAREGTGHGPDVCAVGATGMGLFNLMVGVERGFLTRAQAARRIRQMLRFLATKADRFHGAFPHWLNGRTGKVIPFSPNDDGADLVETAYLAQALLAVREYFSADDSVETELRRLTEKMWREIEWDFFVKEKGPDAYLLWHWSPRVEWRMNHPVRGFNECQITYLLALASPTHAVPAKCYWQGWQGRDYAREREHYGVHVSLGRGLEMPLFFVHYSYLGFDPRAISFEGKTYFEHFRDLCRVQVQYARVKSGTFAGYGPLWGLTACFGPDGYKAFAPGGGDDGTLAPTAALSSMPYVPHESLSCLLELDQRYRARLWGGYGFADSFNLSRAWVSKAWLGIDVGPIAPMIENYRTGLCWRVFMKAPEIEPVLRLLREPQPGPKPS